MLRSLMMSTALWLLAAGSASSGPNGTLYNVKIEARDSSAKILATPAMTLREGSLGKARVGGSEGYEFSLELAEVSDGKVRVQAAFDTARSRMAPKLVVSLGERVVVKTGEISLAITVERASSQ